MDNNKYSEDYKHFDKLIWQLPVWSTAIFVLSLNGAALIVDEKLNKLNIGMPIENMAFGFLFVCWFFQMAIFNAMVRFRNHQCEVKSEDNSVFAKWWYSGQFWLQNAVILQAGSLSFVALSIMKNEKADGCAILIMLLMFFYSLISVYLNRK